MSSVSRRRYLATVSGMIDCVVAMSRLEADVRLGDYDEFSWFSRPRSWGQDGSWRAWFGAKVVDGLCEVLDERLSRKPRKDGLRAASGCVPWLTSTAIVDRLLKFDELCIVMDKGSDAPDRLVECGQSLLNSTIPYLDGTTPNVDGKPVLVAPYTPAEEIAHRVGPVRVLEWSKGTNKPLLHAKLMVVGEVNDVDIDAPGGFSEWRFIPETVWLGSANWTELSQAHLEVAITSTDRQLLYEATSFIAHVIMFSEPMDSVSQRPNPNLLHVDYDHAGMAEAMRDLEDSYMDSLADDEPVEDF